MIKEEMRLINKMGRDTSESWSLIRWSLIRTTYRGAQTPWTMSGVPIVCDISQLTTILTTLYPPGCHDNHQYNLVILGCRI